MQSRPKEGTIVILVETCCNARGGGEGVGEGERKAREVLSGDRPVLGGLLNHGRRERKRDGDTVSRASLDETFSKSVARNFTAARLQVLMFPWETSFIPFVVPLVKFDVHTHQGRVVPFVSDAIVALPGLVVSRWTVLVEFL